MTTRRTSALCCGVCVCASLTALAQPARPPEAELKDVSNQLDDAEKVSPVFSPAAAANWVDSFDKVLPDRDSVKAVLDSGDASKRNELVALFLKLVVTQEVRTAFEVGEASPSTNGPAVYARLFSALRKEQEGTGRTFRHVYSSPTGGECVVVINEVPYPFRERIGTQLTDPIEFYFTPDQAAVLRYIGDSFSAFPIATTREERIVASKRLADVDIAWENYLTSGYSQYPWELALNTWLYDSPWYEAPRSQLILLHPEPAASLDVFNGSDNAEADVGVMIHGFGYVHYVGDTRSWFLGGSVSSILTNDVGFGFGAALHAGAARYSKYLPHISAGLYWTDFDDGRLRGDDLVVGLSLDLWRVLDADGGDQTFHEKVLNLIGGGD